MVSWGISQFETKHLAAAVAISSPFLFFTATGIQFLALRVWVCNFLRLVCSPPRLRFIDTFMLAGRRIKQMKNGRIISVALEAYSQPRPYPPPIILCVMNRWLYLDYLNDSTDDSAGDVGVGWAILFSVPCILGAVLFLVGAACARKAIRKWEQSGIMLPIE